MPTGFTSHIYDGTEKSVATYLTRAARGIGAYIHQYQEDPDIAPEPLTVSDHRWADVRGDYNALIRLHNMTPRDKQAAYDAAKEKWDRENAELDAKNEELRARYEEFIQAINDIDFPVDDPQVGEFFASLKSFSLGQLTSAKDADTGVSYKPRAYTEIYPTVDNWYQERVESAAKSLSSSSERLHLSLVNVARQNLIHERFVEWLAGLDEEVDPESLDW